jgi:thiol-disulfide isomerase/thioredoxin
MKKKKTVFWLLLVFALLLGGASVLYSRLGAGLEAQQLASQNEAEPEDGETAEKVAAPDFTVYDAEGGEIRLSDYSGKPVVLNFWASWCGPCKREMPEFQAAFEELGEDIAFLMVNMTDGSRETVDTASSFVEEAGYTFPVYYDQDMDAASAYGAYSLPTTYFIDTEGFVIARAAGAIDGETLQTGIDMIAG